MTPTKGILIAALVFGAAAAGAKSWEKDGDSRFEFEATFEGSPVPGRFEGFDVALQFDPEALADATLEVTVDLTAADMGDDEVNAIIADPIWFASAEHPRAVFRSERIRSSGDGAYVAEGELELKGKRDPVSVPFTWKREGDAARMQGEFSVRRSRFAVGTGEWASGDAIGLDVRLEFDVRLSQAQ